MRRKRDDGFAPARKYIVAIWLDRDAFEAAGRARGQERQLREQKVRHVLLAIRRRFDVDERAREFEKIHSDRLFLEGTIRKEGTTKKYSGCCLSIALHPALALAAKQCRHLNG